MWDTGCRSITSGRPRSTTRTPVVGWIPAKALPEQIMFSTIVVPLDGSDLAATALPVARELAGRFGARLHLVQVVDAGGASLALGANAAAGALTDPAAITAEMEERVEVARSYLSASAEQLSEEGLMAEYEIHDGPPGEGIIAAARAVHADLIVLSSHGRSGLARLVFGSVAEHVVRNAPMPVMVVRAAHGMVP